MNGRTIAKLTVFDEDKKESPFYRAQAHPHEKSKGFLMIDYLKTFFGIGSYDLERRFKREIKKQSKIKWTRDEKGRIISPFSPLARAQKSLKSQKELKNEGIKNGEKNENKGDKGI